MRLKLSSSLIALSTIINFSAPSADACKPCPPDALRTSIQQASVVLEGTVQSIDSSETKAPSGRARITVQVKQWVFQSPDHKTLAPIGGNQNLELSWGTPCMPHPSLPKEKTRNIFFISQISENVGLLTGYCSVPFLEVSSGYVQISGEKPLSLKKLRRKIQSEKSSKN